MDRMQKCIFIYSTEGKRVEHTYMQTEPRNSIISWGFGFPVGNLTFHRQTSYSIMYMDEYFVKNLNILASTI